MVYIVFIILIGPYARSGWSKTRTLSEYKTKKKRTLLFFVTFSFEMAENLFLEEIYDGDLCKAAGSFKDDINATNKLYVTLW